MTMSNSIKLHVHNYMKKGKYKMTKKTKTTEGKEMSELQMTPEEMAALNDEQTGKYLAHGNPEHPDDAGYDPSQGMNTDFNLDDEYKPTPIMAGGNYKANIIGVAHEASKHALSFKICFAENGEHLVMSDGETKIDGSHEMFRVWLPKPGDENEMQSNGKVTKRQGKINSMKRVAEELKIDMNTPQKIAKAIVEQSWIGIPVIASVDIDKYQGVIRNKVSKIVRDASRE